MPDEAGSSPEVPLETIALDVVPVVLPLGPATAGGGVPPVSVGSLLSRSFWVWKQNLWRLIGFGLLVMVPLFLLVLGGTVGIAFAAAAGAATLAAAIAGGVLAIAAAVALGAAQAAGVTSATVQTLADRPLRFGVMVSHGFGRLLPVVAVGLLAGVPVAVGLVLGLVPGLFLACGLAAVVPVVVVERIGPVAAIRRSWHLTRGHRWTILGTAALMYLAMLGITLLGALLQLVPLLGLLASLGVDAAAGALFLIWPAVAYHDLRVHKEGAASDQLARVFE